MRYKGKEVAPSGDEQYIIALTGNELNVIRNLLSSAKKYLPINFETLHTRNIVENINAQMVQTNHFQLNKALYNLPVKNITTKGVERHYSNRSKYNQGMRKVCDRCGNRYRAHRRHEERCDGLKPRAKDI